MSDRWVVIGFYDSRTYGDCECKDTYVEEKVATFDTKKMAEDYIRKARLKTKNDYGDVSHNPRFRKNSLLWTYENAWADKYYPEEIPPHNPVI